MGKMGKSKSYRFWGLKEVKITAFENGYNNIKEVKITAFGRGAKKNMRVCLVEYATGTILKDFDLGNSEKVIKIKKGARVKAVKGNFIKLYKAKRKAVLALSGIGAKVYLYFVYNFCGTNNAIVNYSHEKLAVAIGVTEKTAKGGFDECEKLGILKRKGRTVYFNPAFATVGLGMPEESAEMFGLEE